MVRSSEGRALYFEEKLQFAVLATINAACEEAIYRGIWRCQFSLYLENEKNKETYSNLLQATSFGVAHYRGIPSGFLGVCLTFFFGFLMGLLGDYGHGIGLPIIVHTLVDYFIFAAIARRQAKSFS